MPYVDFTLAASGNAGDRRYVDIPGRAVAMLEGGNAVQIQFDDETPHLLPEGCALMPAKGFRRLQFINTGAASTQVQILVSDGTILDNRKTLNGAVVQNSGDTLVNPAAVSVGAVATQIVAANTARNSLLIQNLGTADAYIGAAAVTTATGIKVTAGSEISLDTGAAVYGITAAGTADVRVLEVCD